MSQKKPQNKKSKDDDTKLHRKYKQSMQKEQQASQEKREARKLSDLENPTVMTVDLRAEASLKKRAYEEEPAQLMPLREQHTKDTLGVAAQHTPELPEPRQVAVGSLYEQIRETNSRLFQARNERVLPMEALARQGLISTNLLTLGQRQDQFAGELRKSNDYVLSMLSQLSPQHSQAVNSQRLLLTSSGTIVPPPGSAPNNANRTTKSTAPPGKKRKKITDEESNNTLHNALTLSSSGISSDGGTDGAPKTATQVKLSIGFTYNDHAFGYERRHDGEKREHAFTSYDREREARMNEFFKDDQLEGDTKFSVRPQQCAMFRNLEAEMREQFESRDVVMQNAAAMTECLPFETVARAYIRRYRYPPSEGQQLCYNGRLCVFYTASPDPNIRYIAPAFFTPRQEEQRRRGEPLDANQCGLCIDCLLLDWTRRYENNCKQQEAPLRPFNHFGVMTGPGEYSNDGMMLCEFNGYNTGITGCVPAYDGKKRCINYTLRQVMIPPEPGSDTTVPTVQTQAQAFVDETGQDF